MSSRLRLDHEHLFEVFVEVARPSESNEEPFVLQKYPETFRDEETLKTLPKFIFPCETESATVDHFTFVLTDVDGKFRFCFCRHATGALTALCVVSCFPWYEIFYKLLNYLAEITNNSDGSSVIPLLQAFFRHPVPLDSGEMCDIISPNFKEKFTFITPNLQNLPTIPESRNLTEYYNAIDANNMMIVFASMLYERRILIVSRKLSRLTASVHASATLLYPMFWQHLYIPILPAHLKDYCSAPMPYLIGIHVSLLERLRVSELGDAVILDTDKNVVHTEYDDLGTLPHEVVSTLRKRLRGQQSDKMSSAMVGDWLARSFLKAMVGLIGGYRDALRFRSGESISFDQDAFIQSRPQHMQPFLQRILQLQIFEQFINDRLEMLNTGKGFSDEFEMENNLMGDKWGTQSRYKDWSNNMRKFKKEGKEKWSEFTGKVKDKSKKAYSNFRSEIDKLRNSPDKADLPSPSVQRNRPQTIPVTSVKPQRPQRPPYAANLVTHKNDSGIIMETGYLQRRPSDKADNFNALDLERRGSECHSACISKRQSADDSELNMTLNRVSLDLMQDQDIQAVFKKSYSVEDLTLIHQGDEESEVKPDLSGKAIHQSDQQIDSIHHNVNFPQSSLLDIDHTEVNKPIPAPRHKRQKQTTVSVIQLEPGELGATEDNEKTVGSDINESVASLRTNNSEDSLENINFNMSLEDLACDKLPVPKPRGSVTRKNAFYNNKRPMSLTRVSPIMQATGVQTIKEARSIFMKTESIPKTLKTSSTSLDQFDPLLTGQLVIDNKNQVNEVKEHEVENDVNLLKDWTGIDFTKRKTAGPPTPPKPTMHSQKPLGFVNMMVNQYNTSSYSTATGLPRMGAYGLPVQNTGPPMMQRIVPQHFTSSTTTFTSSICTSTLPFLNTDKSFQNNKGEYNGSHIVKEQEASDSNTSNAIQDPFSDLLHKAQNGKDSTSELNKTTALQPMIQPLTRPIDSQSKSETEQRETKIVNVSRASLIHPGSHLPLQPMITNKICENKGKEDGISYATSRVDHWETFD